MKWALLIFISLVAGYLSYFMWQIFYVTLMEILNGIADEEEAKMTLLYLDIDERYPNYCFSRDPKIRYKVSCEFSEEEIARIEKAYTEYEAVSEILEKRYDEALLTKRKPK